MGGELPHIEGLQILRTDDTSIIPSVRSHPSTSSRIVHVPWLSTHLLGPVHIHDRVWSRRSSRSSCRVAVSIHLSPLFLPSSRPISRRLSVPCFSASMCPMFVRFHPCIPASPVRPLVLVQVRMYMLFWPHSWTCMSVCLYVPSIHPPLRKIYCTSHTLGGACLVPGHGQVSTFFWTTDQQRQHPTIDIEDEGYLPYHVPALSARRPEVRIHTITASRTVRTSIQHMHAGTNLLEQPRVTESLCSLVIFESHVRTIDLVVGQRSSR